MLHVQKRKGEKKNLKVVTGQICLKYKDDGQSEQNAVQKCMIVQSVFCCEEGSVYNSFVYNSLG